MFVLRGLEAKVQSVYSHRLLSSSFLRLPSRVLNINPQKGMEPMGIASIGSSSAFGFWALANSRMFRLRRLS